MTKNDDTTEITDMFNGRMEVLVGNEFSNRRRAVAVHHREVLDFEGSLAVKLTEHFGVIVCEPDGEDNSGRQKAKLMEPAAVVERATTMAELLAASLREHGHLALMPSLHETPDEPA